MKNWKIWGILALGIVLRFFASSFLYHTDVKAIYRDATTIDSGVISAYKENSRMGNTLPYPPLVYEFFNNYQNKFRFLFSDYFATWMKDWSTQQTENHPKIFRDLFAMKLPMLLVDLLAGWLLYTMAKKERKVLALLLWLLNPITIYAVYGTGQFDILPTFLVVLGVYFWSSKKEWITYVLFGLAGGLKLFPLLLLPFLFLLDRRKLEGRLSGIIFSGVAFVLTFFPIRFSPEIIKTIFTSNLADSMFKAGVDIGGNAILPISLLVYACILIFVWTAKEKPKLPEVIIVSLILILGLTRFHPQWIVWIAPFVVLLLAEGKIDYRIGFWLMITYFGSMLLIADKFTNFGQLKAINNAFDSLGPIRFYLDKTGIGGQLYGFSVAAFLAGGLATSYSLFFKKSVDADIEEIGLVNKVLRIAGIWVISIAAVFAMVHIPLTVFGRYLDSEHSTQDVVAPMTAKTVLTQKIYVNNDNLFLIQVLIKNINLRTRTDLLWTLVGENKVVVAQGAINGTAIGDDYDLNIQFPKISDSKGKTFDLTLSAPGTVVDEEFVFPYDGKTGSLSYRTFFNPGGYWTNLSYSLRNVLSKI